MNIIVADDEKIILDGTVAMLKEIRPKAEVQGFTRTTPLLEYAKDHECDIAFLDIEMGGMSGIDVAKQIKIWHPKVNVIFVTAYEQYMKTAFQMHVRGFLMKPVMKKDLEEELQNLRNPIEEKTAYRVVARCFGNFDVFVNGESLKFKRSKTKELLAYLIDRKGNSITFGEIRAVLWETAGWEKEGKKADHDKNHYFQMLKRDLQQTLRENGIEDIFQSSWNKYAIDPDKISCDYYDYLDNKAEGVRAYNGEYMAQYSWGEIQNVLFRDREKHRMKKVSSIGVDKGEEE